MATTARTKKTHSPAGGTLLPSVEISRAKRAIGSRFAIVKEIVHANRKPPRDQAETIAEWDIEHIRCAVLKCKCREVRSLYEQLVKAVNKRNAAIIDPSAEHDARVQQLKRWLQDCENRLLFELEAVKSADDAAALVELVPSPDAVLGLIENRKKALPKI